MIAKKVLIVDRVGLLSDQQEQPDYSAVAEHIKARGGAFHIGLDKAQPSTGSEPPAKVDFFYAPQLTTGSQILAACDQGQYDGVIAAATVIPRAARFDCGGVRIGAGTGNMQSKSWGGVDGLNGTAPLMNTPGFNARATAQMVFKLLLKVLPDIDINQLHRQVMTGHFDSGKHLGEHSTGALAGKTMAVLGFGHIGREVAKLAQAFDMQVKVFARAKYRSWIESEGFVYAATVVEAASGADVLSPHLGLGPLDAQGNYANSGIINKSVLKVLNPQAVLINFDRAELVELKALNKALSRDKLRFVAIDADIFVDQQGQPSGPLAPYICVAEDHQDKVCLLPHVAADTEHDSRVAGAKQAVDQMMAAMMDNIVINRVGELPEGYTDGQRQTPCGVGAVMATNFKQLDVDTITQLAYLSEELADFWQEMALLASQGNTSSEHCLLRDELINADGAQVTRAANQLKTLLSKHGLQGPFRPT